MEAKLAISNDTDLHKAWHLSSLLLTIGRPVRPTELASRCTLFRSTPEFVEFLCSVHNSPIFLTENLFVTLSSVAFVAFGRFSSNLSRISEFVPRIRVSRLETSGVFEDLLKSYYRKRKRSGMEFDYFPFTTKRVFLQTVDEEEEEQNVLVPSNKIQNTSAKMDLSRSLTIQPGNSSFMTFNSEKSNKMQVTSSILIMPSASLLSYELKNAGQEIQRKTDAFVNREELGSISTLECQFSLINHEKFPHVPDARTVEGILAREPYLLRSRMGSPLILGEAKMNNPYVKCGMNLNEPYCEEVDERMNMSPAETDNTLYACKATVKFGEDDRVREGRENEKLSDSGRCGGIIENLAMNATAHVGDQAILSVDKKRELAKSLSKLKAIQLDPQNPRLKASSNFESIGNYKANGVQIEQNNFKKDKKVLSMKQNSKQDFKQKRRTEDKRENSKEIQGKPGSNFLKNQKEQKLVPDFESFTVEEEEGSGGYGTVYRTKRKHDGVTLAIKCPHSNADRRHIQNEVRMLERFGGKNFVIKYEGSFNYGSADCIVLEHFEHDRPEVLKREIDVFQLQWYGYCLFRALAGLHRQGVVHRDVKPGNFLFSRKVNKGYLIDFNLAMDLHQKYGTTDKSAMNYDTSFSHIPLPNMKSLPAAKKRKFLPAKSLEAINQDIGKDLQNNLKKKTSQIKDHADLSNKRYIIRSQGADGSGITSTKDATSTRIPSAERLREPMPCQGRKELISLAQQAMQGPTHEIASTPASKRKRVAAPPERVDRKVIYLTPMPLHSTGIPVAGAGLLKSKGESKSKKEGPCVGTKGFRAPEVLFRSLYQGTKIDIWSAGVTLLYLITGRSPFLGDPDQNIKDIAKLRGSEDLWEVAKLHNREASFPVELFDMQSLPSKKLRDWCGLHTRRPDLLVPESFYDLMDKCLTVNPRLRISAEEALRHDFFASCHERLRRQRVLRQSLSLDSGTTTLLSPQPQPCQGLQC